MTHTSNSPLNPTPEKLKSFAGDHWYEMTAMLPVDATNDFAAWLEEELSVLEETLGQFSSPKARGESPRR